MRILNIIHPLGWNDKVVYVCCVSKSLDSLNVFCSTPIKRRKCGHGVSHRCDSERRNPISVDEVRSQLRELYDNRKFADLYSAFQ